MKHFLLLVGFGFLAMGASAKAATSAAIPLDTVAGHAHLVRYVSTTLCNRLTNDHSTDFDKLTPPAAMALITKLFTEALQSDSVALLAIIAKAQKLGIEPTQLGQQLGKDAIIQLSQDCPAALPLIVRLGQTEQVQQLASTRATTIGELERKAIEPLATTICTLLAAANAKTPFLKLEPAQRRKLFEQLFEQEFARNRPQLLRYYSAVQLTDEQSRRAIGEKMSYLMMQHPDCAQHLMIIGADELRQQAAAKRTAQKTD